MGESGREDELALLGARTAIDRLREVPLEDIALAAVAAIEACVWIAAADDSAGFKNRSDDPVVLGLRYVRDRVLHSLPDPLRIAIVDDYFTDYFNDVFLGRRVFAVVPDLPEPTRKRHLKERERDAYKTDVVGRDLVPVLEHAMGVLAAR